MQQCNTHKALTEVCNIHLPNRCRQGRWFDDAQRSLHLYNIDRQPRRPLKLGSSAKVIEYDVQILFSPSNPFGSGELPEKEIAIPMPEQDAS